MNLFFVYCLDEKTPGADAQSNNENSENSVNTSSTVNHALQNSVLQDEEIFDSDNDSANTNGNIKLKNFKIFEDNDKKLDTLNQYSKMISKLMHIFMESTRALQSEVKLNNKKSIFSRNQNSEEYKNHVKYNANLLLNECEVGIKNVVYGVLKLLFSHRETQIYFFFLDSYLSMSGIDVSEYIDSIKTIFGGIKEDENHIYYLDEDGNKVCYCYIENGILHIGNSIEYQIETNILTIRESKNDKEISMYNILQKMVNGNVIKFVAKNKGQYFEDKSGKITLYLNNIAYLSINTEDKYLPKYIISYFQSYLKDSKYNSVKNFYKMNYSKISEDISRWILSTEKNEDLIKHCVKNGLISTLIGKMDAYQEAGLVGISEIRIGKNLKPSK